MKRAKAQVKVYRYYDDFEWETYPVLLKEELDLFHTKVLLKQKPKGLNYIDKHDYVEFNVGWTPTAWGLKRDHTYAVSAKDYIEILAGRPHVPNKKEGKKLRQETAKTKR